VRGLAQLAGRALRLQERLADEPDGVAVPALERPAGELERDDRVDQPLLSPIVKGAYHPPALLVGRRHDPSARGGEVGLRLRRRQRP
jgi:hypothetical protein